jgi:hypothetical protein
MGTNVAGSWQKAAELLQVCSKGSDSEAVAAWHSVQGLVLKLDQLPAPPKAVWKKLVQQLMVCCIHDMSMPACCTVMNCGASLSAPGSVWRLRPCIP